MLYPVRFVEIPKNSLWYLLHNNFQQNNDLQEINGINKNDLIKLKQKFKCSILSENEKLKKKVEQLEEKIEELKEEIKLDEKYYGYK